MWHIADSKQQNRSYKMALYKAKKYLLEQKMNYMIDPLSLVPTDIVPIVNMAWNSSFVNIQNNLVIIQERGWNPLNYVLLDSDDIKLTMTNSDVLYFKSILKLNSQSNNADNELGVDTVEGSASTSTKTISKLSGPNLNYDPKFLSVNAPVQEVSFSSKMNFQSDHSQRVLESLVHHHDLTQAWESTKANKAQGDAMKKKSFEIKKLTDMCNFKNIGCRIGRDSLQLKQLISKEKEEREEKKKLDKEKKEADRKRRNVIHDFENKEVL